MGVREFLIGDPNRYNYSEMCIPTYPCKPKDEQKKVNFYTK